MNEEQAKRELRTRMVEQPRSKIAKFVRLLPEIEASLSSGYTYQQCVDLLNELGADWSLAGFKALLQRARAMSEEEKQRYRGLSSATTMNSPTDRGHTAAVEKTENHQQPTKEKPIVGTTAAIDTPRRSPLLLLGDDKPSCDINPMPDLKDLW